MTDTPKKAPEINHLKTRDMAMVHGRILRSEAYRHIAVMIGTGLAAVFRSAFGHKGKRAWRTASAMSE